MALTSISGCGLRCLALLLGLWCAAAQAELDVFACEPEWASLATEIGGERVKVFAATHATQDPHHIRARPSLIAKAGRADMIFCSGADLEVGWLPILLRRAKASVQPGQPGHLMAADFVPVLEKAATVDRSMGDVHPKGNPHVHLNPDNVLLVAKELEARLALIDPDGADVYRGNMRDFSSRWNVALATWRDSASSLRGKSVVVHHKSFSYLLDWLGMEGEAALEPKPGIPPTVRHLEHLLQLLEGTRAVAIIRSPYDPAEASTWLSDKTGIPALELPYTVGNDSGDLFMLFTNTIGMLQAATGD